MPNFFDLFDVRFDVIFINGECFLLFSKFSQFYAKICIEYRVKLYIQQI